MKELFTIGEMAKLFGVNIRTLRYYDEIGILCPETTDPDSGIPGIIPQDSLSG